MQPSGGLRLAPPVASASSRPTPQNSCLLSVLAGLAAAAREACCARQKRPDSFEFKRGFYSKPVSHSQIGLVKREACAMPHRQEGSLLTTLRWSAANRTAALHGAAA